METSDNSVSATPFLNLQSSALKSCRLVVARPPMKWIVAGWCGFAMCLGLGTVAWGVHKDWFPESSFLYDIHDCVYLPLKGRLLNAGWPYSLVGLSCVGIVTLALSAPLLLGWSPLRLPTEWCIHSLLWFPRSAIAMQLQAFRRIPFSDREYALWIAVSDCLRARALQRFDGQYASRRERALHNLRCSLPGHTHIEAHDVVYWTGMTIFLRHLVADSQTLSDEELALNAKAVTAALLRLSIVEVEESGFCTTDRSDDAHSREAHAPGRAPDGGRALQSLWSRLSDDAALGPGPAPETPSSDQSEWTLESVRHFIRQLADPGLDANSFEAAIVQLAAAVNDRRAHLENAVRQIERLVKRNTSRLRITPPNADGRIEVASAWMDLVLIASFHARSPHLAKSVLDAVDALEFGQSIAWPERDGIPEKLQNLITALGQGSHTEHRRFCATLDRWMADDQRNIRSSLDPNDTVAREGVVLKSQWQELLERSGDLDGTVLSTPGLPSTENR